MNITTEAGNTYEIDPMALANLPTKELLEVHNTVCEDSLKSWKQAKVKLINRILAEANYRPGDNEPTEEDDSGNPGAGEGPEDKPKKSKKSKKDDKKSKKKDNKKSKPKGDRKVTRMSKSWQMLLALVQAKGGPLSSEMLVDHLSTSAGSVASYSSYFRNGSKGHPTINVQKTKEGYYLDKDALATAKEELDNLQSKIDS